MTRLSINKEPIGKEEQMPDITIEIKPWYEEFKCGECVSFDYCDVFEDDTACGDFIEPEEE